RPNVGKSTLINRLLGEERVIASDQPGTTRDSIEVPFENQAGRFVLIDTAGVRRRARVQQAIEKFSVIKALQAIERAHVVILLLDASEGLTDQDLTLLGHVLQQGRALVVGLNKWDGLSRDVREALREELARRLRYLSWARFVHLSALHGSGIDVLMKAVNEAWNSASRELPTSELSHVIQRAFEEHQPPMKQGRTAKLRYAHAGGRNPPRIVIHGTRTDTIPDTYRRYLENRIYKHFDLRGTPLRIEFRDGQNPFKGRRNTLTERQKSKRRRLKKFVKGRQRRR
ncbi:MAG: ribosome biogenesis GTPase Der, partial [Xanthomonadales bacterium]|nr:ribosome biogenesis GTPase Der [Xanthomonadales bacterium]